jgi:hypothetical protein
MNLTIKIEPKKEEEEPEVKKVNKVTYSRFTKIPDELKLNLDNHVINTLDNGGNSVMDY